MYEIQFRAWEKSLQEIIPVHDINFPRMQINTNGAWRLFTEVELMQYTCLTDKWNTEVYEGDIIRQLESWCIVERCIGGFQLKMITGPHEGSTFNFSFLSNKYCEVMGNIHQNPELLQRCTADEQAAKKQKLEALIADNEI